MVKLNHSVKIDNKTITPFLIEGENVYCINRRKETIIIPESKFKKIKNKKRVVIPTQVTTPLVNKKRVVKTKPKEEKIVIKKEEYTSTSRLTLSFSGKAKTNFKSIEKVIETPPVVDNNRYFRPTLDDDYI